MSVNKIIIIGNIGSETPEIRQVGQNTVAKFSVATTEKWRKQDGTIGEETTWHRVELWGQAGVHPYLVKGASVYVEGSYKTSDWQDQQGGKHRDYFIKAFSVQLLSSQQKTQKQPTPAPGYAPAPGYQPTPGYQPAPAPPAPAAPIPPQAPAQPIPPQYPPMNAPEYSQSQTGDLPFSQSPGVRG